MRRSRPGGLREFSGAEEEFARWVHARAWNTGDGPKTIFTDGVKWLRENAVLLPGVTTAARLVSRVRDEALEELYVTLAGLPGPHQAALLESLVVVPDGARYSELELWRRMPSKPTGRGLERSLNRVSEISGTGIGRLDLEAHVPRRRVTDLARHGMAARARLSQFVREHLNVVGKYSFLLPDLGEAGIRELRDPDAEDDEIPD